ncbi:MAG: hypothetical protein CVU91_09320 [Firmicutes bacterium HGW-Firmicutes-16]|nr:MAG: hypothetical protein CVU91_09320 [Firmicutes bacterium HGW-Firmicutes-16]
MGIFGAFLRWLQNINIFEADTELAISHSPWSYAVVIFALLFAVLLFVWLRRYRAVGFASSYPAIYSETVPFVTVAAYIIGVIIAIGGVLTISRAVSTSKTAFDLILGLFSLICAAGMTTFILSVGKPEKKNSGAFGSAVAVFFLCFWLIASYKYSASDPVIWHFAPRLLTISATILAFYFIAGFVFNKPKPLTSLYFSLLGTFMCLAVLADSYPLGEQFITVGFLAAMTLLSFSQVSGAKKAT